MCVCGDLVGNACIVDVGGRYMLEGFIEDDVVTAIASRITSDKQLQ